MIDRTYLAPLAFLAVAASAAPSAFPALGKQTYALDLRRDATPAQFNARYTGLATWGYFGLEPVARREGRRATPMQRYVSRHWAGTLNVDVDADYCPGARTPAVRGGTLEITAYRMSDEETARCGMGRRQWASALVTTQPSFTQTYGYFEVEARIPCDPGRWPAFWLLPTAKTKENAGRLPEIDVFEHYGGALTLQSKNGPVVINRVGQPFSTLHWGVIGDEHKAGNASTLPKLDEAARRAFCAGRHSYGVLWTPTEFRFYIDRRETFRTPNPGVSDPHYLVVNMDISTHAGDPTLAPDPSTYSVYSMKAWALPAG